MKNGAARYFAGRACFVDSIGAGCYYERAVILRSVYAHPNGFRNAVMQLSEEAVMKLSRDAVMQLKGALKCLRKWMETPLPPH
jgi:hypothetical protein